MCLSLTLYFLYETKQKSSKNQVSAGLGVYIGILLIGSLQIALNLLQLMFPTQSSLKRTAACITTFQ